ncbi:unnamed protein product [Auanema sp. JU1783]|nr:unnamed protein product [Auanema sp. JU1783]
MQRLQIVDGEADESDSESDDQQQSTSESQNVITATDNKNRRRQLQQLNFINNNQANPARMRARVHVDEKLTQRWQILGADVLTIVWRRNMPVCKKVEEMENVIESTFNTLKASTTTCRTLSDNMSTLNDTELNEIVFILKSEAPYIAHLEHASIFLVIAQLGDER